MNKLHNETNESQQFNLVEAIEKWKRDNPLRAVCPRVVSTPQDSDGDPWIKSLTPKSISEWIFQGPVQR